MFRPTEKALLALISLNIWIEHSLRLEAEKSKLFHASILWSFLWWSALHSTEPQQFFSVGTNAKEQRGGKERGMYQPISGKCLIIASACVCVFVCWGLTKDDCLHFSWCSLLFLWNESESEKRTKTQQQEAEGDTEQISISQSHAVFCHSVHLSARNLYVLFLVRLLCLIYLAQMLKKCD